ncbi:MAG TPA: hypothetical protein VF729_07630 [Solirubrobacterales bacterium]
MDFLTMIAADALRAVFGADWQNFQENGNWQKHPGRGHAHIHVYGRRRDAREQPFGEALRFPLRSERDEWQVQAPTPDEVEEIRVFVQRNQEAYPAFDAAMAMTQELSD